MTISGRVPRPDGAEIYYEVTGEGPTVLLLHGLGGNHLSWWQQVPALDGYRAVTVSHRGFRPSTAPGPAPDPADFADDIAALLDQLGERQALFVGQSMGGWTTVEFALKYPERIAGALLSSTSGTLSFMGFDDPALKYWLSSADGMAAEMRGRGVHVACGERMAVEQPALHGLYAAVDRLAGTLDKGLVRERLWAQRSRAPTDAGRIACPVLFVTGSEDVVFPPPAAPLLAPYFPNADVVEIPKTGHSPYFERPDIFNGIMRDFLDTVAQRT